MDVEDTAEELPIDGHPRARDLHATQRSQVELAARSIAELQADLDNWVRTYNEERPHQGRWCFGKTPMNTFLDAVPIAREKLIAA